MYARWMALRALGDSGLSPVAREGVVATLCLLGWRSAGASTGLSALHLPPGRLAELSLTLEENQVLIDILSVISVQGLAYFGLPRLHLLLGAETPVGVIVIRDFGQIW